MGKGEIACYKQFLLFPQCFQKACFSVASKGVIVLEWVNSLPNDEIWDQSNLKAYANDNLNVVQMMIGVTDWVEKIVWKKRKCWLLAFSPFHTMFSKGFFFWVIKSRDCMVKSWTKFIYRVCNLRDSKDRPSPFVPHILHIWPPRERICLKTFWEKDINAGKQHFIVFHYVFYPSNNKF